MTTNAKNPADTDKGDFEKERAKSENAQNREKQKAEEKAIREGATAGNIELDQKLVPSNPSNEDPNRAENDFRKNPDANPNLKK